MLFTGSVANPPVVGEDFDERWNGPDKGLICAWLRGLEIGRERPELRARALADELPPLIWKGGVEDPPLGETPEQSRARKRRKKIGTLLYVATWQGVRGEDLCVDDSLEVVKKCTRWEVTVQFTGNLKKLMKE